MTTIKSTIEILRELREDNDFSQKQIAEMLGISQQQYSQYEMGTVEFPLRHFRKLSEFYDISADYLLGKTDRPQNKSYRNVYLTRNYSCIDLANNVMSLSEEGRKSVIEYIKLQKIKEKHYNS